MRLRDALTDAERKWLDATFLPYQRAWILDDATVAVAVKARQIGFTDATLARAVLLARRGRTQVFLTCNEPMARSAIESASALTKFLHRFDGNGFVTAGDGELRWLDGGRLIAMEANPRTARSFSGDLYLDEMDYMLDQQGIVDAAFPIASRGDFTIRLCSTPKLDQRRAAEAHLPSDKKTVPPSVFRQYVLRAGGMAWPLHRVTLDDARSHGLALDIEKCRLLVGGDERLWRNAYEGSFEDGEKP